MTWNIYLWHNYIGYEYYYLRPKSAAAKATAATVPTPLLQYARITASGVAQCVHLGYISTNGSCNLRLVWCLRVMFQPSNNPHKLQLEDSMQQQGKNTSRRSLSLITSVNVKRFCIIFA